jgi:hypothetical protein
MEEPDSAISNGQIGKLPILGCGFEHLHEPLEIPLEILILHSPMPPDLLLII